MCGIMLVMYGSVLFLSVLANVKGSKVGLYQESRLLFLLGCGMGMMFASFHMYDMILVHA